jgi:hypothetical protein
MFSRNPEILPRATHAHGCLTRFVLCCQADGCACIPFSGKRRIVERSFAWMDKRWRMWKNCERKLHIAMQMIKLVFIRILTRYLKDWKGTQRL